MNIPRILVEIQDPQRFELLFTDLIADCIHGVKLEYLQKYPEITNYGQIVEAQNFLQQISEVMLELNRQDEDEIAKLMEKIRGDLNDYQHKLLSRIIRANYKGLARTALYHQVAMSKYMLKDFNWNINLTISSDKISTCQKPSLILELILDTLDESKPEKRVIFEMNKEELEQFLTKILTLKPHFFD